MKSSQTLRAVFYLLLSLFGMLLGSLLPQPLSTACHLLFVLLALFLEKRCFEAEASPRLYLRSVLALPRLWLLFPAFAFCTMGANLLSARITAALGGTLPGVTPSLPLFFGAVLLAPIAEELLFRGLLLRLFIPYGERGAVLLSAVLFALAHGSIFQIPYALVAGLFLGYTAVCSKGLFYPLVFHLLYNLFAFFGNAIPTRPLLLSLLGLAIFSLLLFVLGKHPSRLTRGKRPTAREMLPLLLYATLMIVFAVFNF